MATGKVIGQIQVAEGNIKVIGVDGVVREPKYSGYVFENEQVVSSDPNALFQIKFLALPEASAYDGIFRVLADGSVVYGRDAMESVASDESLVNALKTSASDAKDLKTASGDAEDLETAAGEEGAEGSSSFTETEIVASSSVLGFNRGPNTPLGYEEAEFGSIPNYDALAPQEATEAEDAINNNPIAMAEDITKIADHEIVRMSVAPTLEGTSVYEKNGWYGIRDDGDKENAYGNPLIDSHGEDEGIKFIFTSDVKEATLEFKNVGDNPQDNDNILIELWNNGGKLTAVDVDTSSIKNFTPFVINEGVFFDEIRIIALDPVDGNGNPPTEFRVSSVVATDLDRDWVLPFIIDDAMLLANDSDIDDDALHIELVDGDLYASDGETVIGSVSIITDTSSDNYGDIQVTPYPINEVYADAPDYASFTYVVVDEHGLSSEPVTATIDVAIGEVTVPEISYDHNTGEFIIGTDSGIESPDVLSDNILTVDGTLDLSHISDINTIELGSGATVLGSSELGYINPSDVIGATDINHVLVIHSAEGDDASSQVNVDESFGDALEYEGGSTPNLGVEGVYYNQYTAEGATLLIEISPIEVE